MAARLTTVRPAVWKPRKLAGGPAASPDRRTAKTMSNHDKGLLVLATLLLAVTPTAASAQSIRFHGG